MTVTNRFRRNENDYTTFPSSLGDRFVETRRIERADRPWLTRIGFYRWRAGDYAAVHLTESLPWTLVEVRILSALEERDSYHVVIDRFDGEQQTLAGLSIGDECIVKGDCFFAVWGPGQTRDDGEGAQKIYIDGTTTRW